MISNRGLKVTVTEINPQIKIGKQIKTKKVQTLSLLHKNFDWAQ